MINIYEKEDAIKPENQITTLQTSRFLNGFTFSSDYIWAQPRSRPEKDHISVLVPDSRLMSQSNNEYEQHFNL